MCLAPRISRRIYTYDYHSSRYLNELSFWPYVICWTPRVGCLFSDVLTRIHMPRHFCSFYWKPIYIYVLATTLYSYTTCSRKLTRRYSNNGSSLLLHESGKPARVPFLTFCRSSSLTLSSNHVLWSLSQVTKQSKSRFFFRLFSLWGFHRVSDCHGPFFFSLFFQSDKLLPLSSSIIHYNREV